MDLNMCLTSYLNVVTTSKNFGGSLKERVVICKIEIFWILQADFRFRNDFQYIIFQNHWMVTFLQLETVPVYCLIMLLHSTRAQEHKQVSNNLFWCSYCRRKVYARSQTRSVAFKIFIFWVIFVKIWPPKSFRVVENTKITKWWRFCN